MSAPEPLADALLNYARAATGFASQILNTDQPRSGTHAAAWMRSVHAALEARNLAGDDLTDGERAATALLVGDLRLRAEVASSALAGVEEDREALAELLDGLASTFESQPSPTSLRLAGRIRRTLGQVYPAFVSDREAGEAALEALDGDGGEG